MSALNGDTGRPCSMLRSSRPPGPLKRMAACAVAKKQHAPHSLMSRYEIMSRSSTYRAKYATTPRLDLAGSTRAAVSCRNHLKRHLLLFEVLDSTSLSLVQMLCLTGVYLQSTQHANRCWNSVGLAIRVAQSLGLHLNEVGGRKIPQLEREMRRRVWHTCVVLDR